MIHSAQYMVPCSILRHFCSPYSSHTSMFNILNAAVRPICRHASCITIQLLATVSCILACSINGQHDRSNTSNTSQQSSVWAVTRYTNVHPTVSEMTAPPGASPTVSMPLAKHARCSYTYSCGRSVNRTCRYAVLLTGHCSQPQSALCYLIVHRPYSITIMFADPIQTMFRMAGQTAGPIETKPDTRTHVHPGCVSVKVNVKVIHVCVRE